MTTTMTTTTSSSEVITMDQQFDDAGESASIQTQDEQNKPKLLSKWIKRLIHPELRNSTDDVIVIQSPEIIPLSDTFILDFGRRVREDEATFGITPLDIDHKILDDDEHDQPPEVATTNPASTATHPTKNKKLPRKVKITNIKYVTTAAMIEKTLEDQFGPIEYMNLIMQPPPQSTNTTKSAGASQHSELNSGLAYVTFDDPDAALKCSQELNTLDQRPVSVTLLTNSGNPGASGQSNHTGGSTSNSSHNVAKHRYWSDIDLSIQCYQCGQTGHRSFECPNRGGIVVPATDTAVPLVTPRTTTFNGKKPRRPCPLCANRTDHSEIYACPNRHVCFNCGIPGHVSRDCQSRRLPPPQNINSNNNNMIARSVCTICYTLNHHTKYTCPWTMRNQHRNHHTSPQVHPTISTISSDAICASCGRPGHFLCQELKWFYGLNGVSCWNCGMPDHIGAQCPRPNLEACSRNEETVLMEIERATAVRSVEQSIFDANSKEQQEHRINAKPSSRRNDTHHTSVAAGQSRYGSIDQSRNNNVNGSIEQYDRGRQRNRQQQQQPQFRPYKSMPPPKRQHHQQNDNNHFQSGQRPNNNTKRNRNGAGGHNEPDLSSPQHKRRRPN